MQSAIEVISIEDASPCRIAPCERFDLRCPDCGDFLRLIHVKAHDTYFYGCRLFVQTGCKGSHTANKDGSPRGVPGNAETRKWRRLAHETFDRLWKEEPCRMTREQAYFWLGLRFNLSLNQRDQGIGGMDARQCERLIELVKQEYPEFRTSWDRLGDESF